jgi:flagellar biosynthesis protein FlhB
MSAYRTMTRGLGSTAARVRARYRRLRGHRMLVVLTVFVLLMLFMVLVMLVVFMMLIAVMILRLFFVTHRSPPQANVKGVAAGDS